jgi:hypothetical protein
MFKRLRRRSADKRPPAPATPEAAAPADGASAAGAPPIDGSGLRALLAQVLEEAGRTPVPHADHLLLDGELQVFVELIEVAELPPDGVRTATVIQVRHRRLFPDGLAEFQHAAGKDVAQSLASGFATWARTDLVALSEAVSVAREDRRCMTMRLELPPPAAHLREVVLGPVARLGGAAQAAVCDAGDDSEEDDDEEGFDDNVDDGADADADEQAHAFCPCCLFTQSLEAFLPLLEGDTRMLGIRLFATRDAAGEIAADCRINGVDFPEGAACLRRYAATWPAYAGLEFRKQYVVVFPPEPLAAPPAHNLASEGHA